MTYVQGLTADKRITKAEIELNAVTEHTKYMDLITSAIRDEMKEMKQELKEVRDELTDELKLVKTGMNEIKTIVSEHSKETSFKRDRIIIGSGIICAIVLAVVTIFKDPILKAMGL